MTRIQTIALALAISSWTAPLAAQPTGCGLLKPSDLTSLLGSTPTATPSGTGCLWKAGDKKLLAMLYKVEGDAASAAFEGARRGAGKGGKSTVIDEPGLGDRAFATVESFGVVIVMLKKGRLLQLQLHTGAAGSTGDVDALRPVAKVAIGAF